MFKLYRRVKWIYQKFKLSTWVPFVALVSYTIFGAFLFKSFEMENDQRNRERFRNRTLYAMNQVLERMLEVRCHDSQLRIADKTYQVKHAKEALLWFLDHLNLTEVISERTEDTPWTWLGSMFYAGQLYTTIGYGFPITSTAAGRITSIFYILFGIPIFLIILKDIGRLMSRGCRKLYKRLRTSRRKIADAKPVRRVSQYFTSFYKLHTVTTNDGVRRDPELAEQQNKANARLHAENAFPIPIALSMLFLWILFSATLFCYWEQEWGYLTSIYFFFVSISTVGLGDIVFMNPDMMIFNFMLILIGLALLSMCFNLIQAALERMLDRLVEEYIVEIEKMAEIVTSEELAKEEVAPLELRMTGNLLALPMKKVTKDTGFLAEAKEWVAGRIANNLLVSRLGPAVESSSSDSEGERECERNKESEEEELRRKVSTTISRQPSIASATLPPDNRRPSKRLVNFDRPRILPNKPLFNTIRALNTIKPHKEDFRSIIFSKFLQSERLSRIVEDTPPKRMVNSCCQTDNLPTFRIPVIGRGSTTSSSMSEVAFDEESLLSTAYCDIKFYSSTDFHAVSRQHSSFSVLRVDDDDPIRPSELRSPIWFTSWNPPPKITVEQSACAYQPSSLLSVEPLMKEVPSSRSRRGNSEPPLSTGDETLERVRSVCGLMPSDFDSHSISSRLFLGDDLIIIPCASFSFLLVLVIRRFRVMLLKRRKLTFRSTMVDSGYDRSHHEDVPKPATDRTSPYWLKEDTVDENAEGEMRRAVLASSALAINQRDVKEEEPAAT